jgi:hypothetical protein
VEAITGFTLNADSSAAGNSSSSSSAAESDEGMDATIANARGSGKAYTGEKLFEKALSNRFLHDGMDTSDEEEDLGQRPERLPKGESEGYKRKRVSIVDGELPKVSTSPSEKMAREKSDMGRATGVTVPLETAMTHDSSISTRTDDIYERAADQDADELTRMSRFLQSVPATTVAGSREVSTAGNTPKDSPQTKMMGVKERQALMMQPMLQPLTKTASASSAEVETDMSKMLVGMHTQQFALGKNDEDVDDTTTDERLRRVLSLDGPAAAENQNGENETSSEFKRGRSLVRRDTPRNAGSQDRSNSEKLKKLKQSPSVAKELSAMARRGGVAKLGEPLPADSPREQGPMASAKQRLFLASQAQAAGADKQRLFLASQAAGADEPKSKASAIDFDASRFMLKTDSSDNSPAGGSPFSALEKGEGEIAPARSRKSRASAKNVGDVHAPETNSGRNSMRASMKSVIEQFGDKDDVLMQQIKNAAMGVEDDNGASSTSSPSVSAKGDGEVSSSSNSSSSSSGNDVINSPTQFFNRANALPAAKVKAK